MVELYVPNHMTLRFPLFTIDWALTLFPQGMLFAGIIIIVLTWALMQAYVFSYREKAMQDASVVSKHVESLLQSVGKVCETLLCSLRDI